MKKSMKKLLARLLAGGILFGVAACGCSAATAPNTDTPSGTVAPSESGSATASTAPDGGGSTGIMRENVEGKTITLSDGTVFPNRQIELIVPLSAGGGTDVFCRQLASAMYKIMGQPVVVNNLPGASGLRGIGVAMTAEPDGYTLVASNPPGEQIAYLSQDPGYDMSKLTSIAGYSSDVIVLIASSDLPYNTFPELVEAYQNGDLRSIGTPGKGDAGHIGIGLVKEHAGLDYKNAVTYEGSGDVVAALIRKEIEVGIAPSSAIVTAVADGTVKPIMVLSQERFPTLPDVPAYGADYGYESIDGMTVLSRCIFAPEGLPEEIQRYLQDVIEEATQDPELIEWAAGRNLPVLFSNSEKTAEILSTSLEVGSSVDLDG